MVSRAFPAECKILSFLLAVGTKNVERRNLLPLSTNKLSNILFLLNYILSNLLERRNKYNFVESRSGCCENVTYHEKCLSTGFFCTERSEYIYLCNLSNKCKFCGLLKAEEKS